MKTVEELRQHLAPFKYLDEFKAWSYDLTAEEAWHNCHRGDWMLLWCSSVDVDFSQLTLAKGLCAELAIDLMEHEASKAAVRSAISFGRGLITFEQMNAAAIEAAACCTHYFTKDDNGTAYAAYASAVNNYAVGGVYPYTPGYVSASYTCEALENERGLDAGNDARKRTADIVRQTIKPTWKTH